MILVDRKDWAMAQQIHLYGTVAVPAGSHSVTTTIGGGSRSTVLAETVSGPANHALDVEHFAIRSAADASAAAMVLIDDDCVLFDRGTVAAQPAHGPATIGAHFQPTIYDSIAALALLPTMKDARFGMAMHDCWPSSTGVWDSALLSGYSALMTELHSRGMKAIVTCGTTPNWAGNGGDQLAPGTASAHGAFVADIVQRWGADIIAVDPWNEPDLSMHGTAAQYVAMLRAVRAAVDPAMPVSLGPFGISSTAGATPWSYLEACFVAGLTGSDFDRLDVHPYPYSFQRSAAGELLDPHGMPPAAALDGSPIGSVHKLEATLEAHGITGKHLICSEIGVSTNEVDPVNPALRATDAAAAALQGTIVDQLRRIPHMDAVIFHEAKDSSASTFGWNSKWGCLDSANLPRARWTTLQAAAS